MRITRIKINYYKSIKEPMILDLHDINVVIGQNNSGKSNILDAIEFALTDPKTDSQIFYPKADIEIDLKFTEDEQLKYEFPEAEAVFTLKKGIRELGFSKRTLPFSKTLSSIFAASFKRLNEKTFLDYPQIENDFRSLFTYSQNLASFKENLSHHFPKVSATENALDINYEHEGLYEGDRRATIDRMGSGFRRIFTILLYIFHPQYSIVLIEEPEIHLHPAMIKKLLWAMQNSESGQIFFTTHSPLFITPMTLSQLIRVMKNEKTSKAFSLGQGNVDHQRLIQELNADNLEMFFTDKVVLVEGVSDRILLRGLIDRFYKGQNDLKVVQTHGKGNVLIYVKLLKVFNIPFAIILDNDAIKTHHIRDLVYNLDLKLPPMTDRDMIEELKKYDIYIFANGDLEANYPRKFQNEETKTLSALKAARFINDADFNSKHMANLREIINSL